MTLERYGFLSLLPMILSFKDNFVCEHEPLCRYKPAEMGATITCGNFSATTMDSITGCLRQKISKATIRQLKLINCSLPTLPSHAFHDIKIYDFYMTCPFSDFPIDTVSKINRLQILAMVNTTFESFPSDLPVMKNLYILHIVGHKIKTLETELWKFPSLVDVNISYGALEEISKNAFDGAPELLFINLRNNHLTYLHADTLNPVKKLLSITLESNHIYTLDGLFDYISPTDINLADNNLTSVDNVFIRPMFSLRWFIIRKNPIQSIGFTLRSTAPNLYVFDMSKTGCTKLNSDFVFAVPYLSTLDLSHNKFESIPFIPFLQALRTLRLNHNFLTSIEDRLMPDIYYYLSSLFLSHNQFSKIGDSFKTMFDLRELDVSHNDIEDIRNSNFIYPIHLEHLDLSYNRIELIESNSFKNLKNLAFLSLAGNGFTNLNSSLQNLFALETLLINSTKLETLGRSEFLGLRRLSYLNLENNRIQSLNGAFQYLPIVQSLNIAKNSLATFTRNNFPRNVTLEALWFAESKQLHCDCRIKWIIQWLPQTKYSGLKDNPVCYFPLRHQGKTVKELTLNDVVEWPENCPYPCSCECDSEETDLSIRVDCSRRNVTDIPENFPEYLRHLNLSGNDLGPVVNLSSNWTQDLIVLDLERNKITTLYFNIPESMEVLKLAGNLLKRPPWSIISNKSIKVLTLSHNPWLCDCETVNFRKWLLSEGNAVTDVNETKCGPDGPLPNLYGQVITALEGTALCPAIISVYASIAIGITSFLVAAVLMTLAFTKYHLYIKVWLYAHGYTWVKEDDMDTEKIFDGLVSYHHTAEEFVFQDLAPRLEQEEPRFTLCIPERDIVCGEFSATAEMTAVRDSKRIIVLLNEEYINDMYCMSILEQAFRQSLKDKIHRVILIKLCDIAKSEDMSPELKVTLESTNCISLNENLFWERLRYAMPKKIRNPRGGPDEMYPIHHDEF